MAMNNSNQNRKNFLTFFKAEDTPGTVLLGSRQMWQDRKGKEKTERKGSPNSI
jgi:hypothetical protein